MLSLKLSENLPRSLRRNKNAQFFRLHLFIVCMRIMGFSMRARVCPPCGVRTRETDFSQHPSDGDPSSIGRYARSVLDYNISCHHFLLAPAHAGESSQGNCGLLRRYYSCILFFCSCSVHDKYEQTHVNLLCATYVGSMSRAQPRCEQALFI